MRIEIISGSARKSSNTRKIALFLRNYLSGNSDHEIGLIDMQEWDLPHIQAVIRSESEAPAALAPLAKRIFLADAFILVSPEYNGSYSPALKNLLDHFPKQHRKPFGIVTASPGPLGGIRAALQMQQLVPALFGIASPYMLIVPDMDKKFDREGQLIDEGFRKNVDVFVNEFLWLSEKLVDEPVAVSR